MPVTPEDIHNASDDDLAAAALRARTEITKATTTLDVVVTEMFRRLLEQRAAVTFADVPEFYVVGKTSLSGKAGDGLATSDPMDHTVPRSDE